MLKYRIIKLIETFKKSRVIYPEFSKSVELMSWLPGVWSDSSYDMSRWSPVWRKCDKPTQEAPVFVNVRGFQRFYMYQQARM